jgi:hypothetical protein
MDHPPRNPVCGCCRRANRRTAELAGTAGYLHLLDWCTLGGAPCQKGRAFRLFVLRRAGCIAIGAEHATVTRRGSRSASPPFTPGRRTGDPPVARSRALVQ